jgi:hypothetical protein
MRTKSWGALTVGAVTLAGFQVRSGASAAQRPKAGDTLISWVKPNVKGAVTSPVLATTFRSQDIWLSGA